MHKPAEEFFNQTWHPTLDRRRIVIVSSDEKFAEWLRGQLAGEFDVLIARHAGEAVAKSKAVGVGIALVDLGAPLLGAPALTQLKQLDPSPVICALAIPDAPDTHPQIEFDYVLARPSSASDMAERIRFIQAKVRSLAD